MVQTVECLTCNKEIDSLAPGWTLLCSNLGHVICRIPESIVCSRLDEMKLDKAVWTHRVVDHVCAVIP